MRGWRIFGRPGFGGPGKGRQSAGGRDKYVHGRCHADASVEGPVDAQDVTGAASGRKGDYPADDFVARRACGDVAGGAQRFSVFEDARWDFVHGGRSLAVSAMAAFVLVVLDGFDPSGPDPERVLGTLAGYVCGLWTTVAADRWLYARRQAVPPPDRFGDGRKALLMAAVVLWLSGTEAGEALAPWLAVAAVLIGSFADGSWIFVASMRSGIGFRRALRELVTGERSARRQCWIAMFGESGR